MMLRTLLLAAFVSVTAGRGRPGMPNKEEKLRRAAEMGELDDVRNLILKEKVNINAVPMFGETPLHWTSASGHQEVADFLIDNGADVRAP